MTQFTVVRTASILAALVLAGPGAHAGISCDFPELDPAAFVILEPGASPPAGTGGVIESGRWELVRLRYSVTPDLVALSGTALGAFELVALDDSSGFGSLSLEVSINSPVSEFIDEEAAGPYAANGNQLVVENVCGDDALLGEVEYSIDSSGENPRLILWGSTSFEVNIGFPITVTVQLQPEFERIDAPELPDPVFDDRFES